MVFRKKFISIWNEIKKFYSFVGKKIAVDPLNDTTAFPFFLYFFKNFYTDHRKCKSNSWDYLISIHQFSGLLENDKTHERDRLIRKYNERLLAYSKNKINPWVIDDRDENCLTLNKKKYLEFNKKFNFIIDEEIANKVSSQNLTKKEIQLAPTLLLLLAKLALLKTYKENSIEKLDALGMNCQDWEEFRNQFRELISLEFNHVSIECEIKKRLKNNNREFYVRFSIEKKSVRISSASSIWEKINKFAIKNKAIQFFSSVWSGFTSHANLLNWSSFFLLFFSLSLYGYPAIFLILGISLMSYLIINLLFLLKKDSIILAKINKNKAEKILESIKLEVFNKEKDEHEFKLILKTAHDLLRKNPNPKTFLDSIATTQKKINPSDFESLKIEKSQLYQYLTEVYPKTQFIASLWINLSSLLLYTYLLTWAIKSCLIVLGVASLAAIISSPAAVGILILIAAGVFLMRHFCEFRAREDFYQRAILEKINNKSEYYFKDERGQQCVIQIEKWKKLEYLQDNICLLESKFKNFFKENHLDYSNNKFYSLLNAYILKKNVYDSYDQKKVSGASNSLFKILKKFLNRFFAFSGGGLCGYNLTQQIVWKSKLGFHILVKMFTLPILLIFIPLIIINGIANLITYHLHSRQRNRFEVAENLDNKLEILEQINKNLLHLATLLSPQLKHSEDSNINLNVNPKAQLDLLLLDQNKCLAAKTDKSSFFRKNSYPQKNNSLNLETRLRG